MSTKDKLEEIAAAMRARWHASEPAVPSHANPIGGENASGEDGPINAGSTGATLVPEAERENQVTQPLSPLARLDLDTAIRLRWALRDIKAKRTKLTPVRQSDLVMLIEMGLVEIRDDTHVVVTNEGRQALDH
ncbi:hypothetical protein [Bradyrhizobium retamae]|uniref:hypothetical protein n=1 Tax=Bradyrhizobium retamae TaxID=1300035 RepID=UPI000B11533C